MNTADRITQEIIQKWRYTLMAAICRHKGNHQIAADYLKFILLVPFVQAVNNKQISNSSRLPPINYFYLVDLRFALWDLSFSFITFFFISVCVPIFICVTIDERILILQLTKWFYNFVCYLIRNNKNSYIIEICKYASLESHRW